MGLGNLFGSEFEAIVGFGRGKSAEGEYDDVI